MRLLAFSALLLTIATAAAGPTVRVLVPQLDYPGADYTSTSTTAVSNNGTVVGWVRDPSGLAVLFERLPGSGYTTPVGFPHARATYACGVNISNLVCGWCEVADGSAHGFFYDPATATFTRYDLPDRVGTRVTGLNDAGDFCGSTDSSGFVSIGGALVEFSVPGSDLVFPVAINNLGQVVGSYRLPRSSQLHGFFRDADGTLTYPMDFPGAIYTQIMGLNDNGLIAGNYNLDDDPIAHGFVRQLQGHSISFDVAGDFGPFLGNINNTGLMVGSYYLSSDSQGHSFLARFVP